MIAVAACHGRSFFDGRELKQSCWECRRNEHAREEWGCEREAEFIQFYIPCVRCGGSDSSCEACQGIGFEGCHRCPNTYQLDMECEYIRLWSARPALPYAGGLYDQPAVYVECMRLLDYARKLMGEAAEKATEREK